MRCPPITDDMFPPPLDVLREACAQTEAHPAAVAIQFLVALGNIIGPDSYALVGETPHRTNEFTLTVGPTSTGRKGDAAHLALAPFEEVDADWFASIAGGVQHRRGVDLCGARSRPES